MRKLAFLILLLAAPAFAITFEEMASIRRIGTPHVSPDGKWIAYDASNIDLAGNARHSAVYLVPSNGGESKKITDGTKQDEGPAWSPNGRTIAYVSNKDGGAKQVWLYDVAAGTSRKLSNLQGGAASVKWLPDGSGVIVVSDVYPDCGVDPVCIKDKTSAEEKKPTQARIITGLLYRHWNAWQEPTRSHLVLVPLNGGAPRDLTPGGFDVPPFSLGGGDEFDVSPDGETLVYASDTEAHPEVSTNSDLFAVKIKDAQFGRATATAPRRLTTRTGADTSPLYSPDGRYIAWRSQSRAGYESDLWELWILDRQEGQSRRIAPAFDNYIDSVAWAPDSKSMFVTAPEQTNEAIYEVSVADGTMRRIYANGSADGVAVTRDGQTLYFERSTLERPADIYGIGRNETAARQITHDNDALLSKLSIGKANPTWWTGAENAKVQGLVVTPPEFDPMKKYPGIMLIHGGPQGAWMNSWGYRWNPQIFASRGYVVLMPNPRGSTGYGQKFVEEISGDWGGKVYTDIMNGVDQFAALPYVDGTRLGAAGGSYGGYMVDWILGHSTRFKALVSHAGVYDLVSMYGVTEELWFAEWEFHGNPWDNPELYQKWSPNQFVKNFATPTLVSHGELDFRVPIGQGLELFTALQRRGIPSKLLYFPDEGHWVLKPQNSKLWYQTVGDWFDQYLR
ncbi:MAG TPA: S9 family peptidase [Thermoanaerobaculia bacterium]|jgi:dipeptidyl aminopeptidase/acylaminoacyl peptidase